MTYLTAITIVHTAISFVALAAGCLVVAALLNNRDERGPNSFFLASAALASLTGFVFPFAGITPAQIVGLLAVAILAACWRLRETSLASPLRRAIYVGGLVASLYLLAFVGVVQAFKHLAPLKALAPNGNEPPFVVAEVVTLALFAAVGLAVVLRFRGAAAPGGVLTKAR
jgi:hypothetical protein